MQPDWGMQAVACNCERVGSQRVLGWWWLLPADAACGSIMGLCHLHRRHNPANWMLEQTSPAFENKLGLDFGTMYRDSKLAK